MKPISQTRNGGPDTPPEGHGDCFRACVCSLLELPHEAFESPSPALPHNEWAVAWQRQLMERGFWMAGIEVDPDDEPWYASPGYWIASVPSLNLGTDENGDPIRHAVVMHGTELAHDPSTQNRYTTSPIKSVLGARWLVPLDPAPPQEGTDG